MRLDRPAASTMAAIFGARGVTTVAVSSAPARGCGRVGISFSSPPAPMRMMSDRVTGRSAIRRCSTQSKPFTFGERTQPGSPSTWVSSARRPSNSRLPGSTGMPK